MENYNQNSIVSLSAGKAFRTKLGMYLSADKQEAINLGLRELIVNVQDEYEVYKPANPFCKISLNTKTHEICVEDNMRGIPCGVRDDGINSLTAAFLIPHSGGKHEEGAYASAIGLNGEGNKIVCHTASWLKVEVKRDKKIYSQSFTSTDEGATADAPVQEQKDPAKKQITGTKITYVPDPKVYGNVFIDLDKLRQMLTEISYFTRGLKIELIVDGNSEIFLSKNGLIDGLVSEYALSAPFQYFYSTDDCQVELALQWVKKRGVIKGYANGLYMPDGGAFISGFKTSLTKTFNSLGKTKFDGDVIRNMLNGFCSVKVRVGQFSNQAKTALANPEARTAASTAITSALKEFYKKRKNDFDEVVDILKKMEKAEAAADKARLAVLNHEKETTDKKTRKMILSNKLKDCRNHGEDSMLGITEGDSGLGAMVQSRPIDTVALMPIRGKIISGLKHDLDEILQNEEVKAIFAALGCGILDKYDSRKLRYGKVGIMADSDKDGLSIGSLLITLFYRLCPKFLQEGRMYWIRMPLYVLDYGKKVLYAFDEKERDELFKTYGTNCVVSRKKGLGENSAEDNKVAVFGEQKRWEQLVSNDWETFCKQIEMMMGKDTTERKQYVQDNVDFSHLWGE